MLTYADVCRPQHYASLEAHLKAVIVNEDTSEQDVRIALDALTEAEQEAMRCMVEAEEAEEAARRYADVC